MEMEEDQAKAQLVSVKQEPKDQEPQVMKPQRSSRRIRERKAMPEMARSPLTVKKETNSATVTVTESSSGAAVASSSSSSSSSASHAMPPLAPVICKRKKLTTRRHHQSSTTGGATASCSAASSAAGHGTASTGASTTTAASSSKILGRFSVKESLVICEEMLLQLKENTMHPQVLQREWSPSQIDWKKLALRLKTRNGMDVLAKDCESLWNFLSKGRRAGGDPTSSKTVTNPPNGPAVAVASTTGFEADTTQTMSTASNAPASILEPQDDSVDSTDGMSYYPKYTVSLTDWSAPFDLHKNKTSLASMAGKFLKEKYPPLLVVPSPGTNSSAPPSTTTTKHKLDESNATNVKSPPKKRPRKPMDPAVKAAKAAARAAKKAAKLAAKANASVAKSAAGTATMTGEPPWPKLPRSAFHFFCEYVTASLFPDATTGSKGTDGSTTTTNDQQKLLGDPNIMREAFNRASPEVVAKCQQKAQEEIEKYNREYLRRRLWAKQQQQQQALAKSQTKQQQQLVTVPRPTKAMITATATLATKPLEVRVVEPQACEQSANAPVDVSTTASLVPPSPLLVAVPGSAVQSAGEQAPTSEPASKPVDSNRSPLVPAPATIEIAQPSAS